MDEEELKHIADLLEDVRADFGVEYCFEDGKQALIELINLFNTKLGRPPLDPEKFWDHPE